AIYDMEDVLPKALQSHIDILPFIKNTDAEGYKPFIAARSQFIYKKIERILGVTKPDTVELRRTIYLNYLMRFYGMQNKFLRNRAECIKSLSCSPEIADAIFDTFTDCDAGSHNQDGSPVFVKTTATENKLACYIAVLMLSLNKWTAYPSELAADLNIPGKKAETYFQNVGCKLEAASAADIAANTYSKRPRSGGNKIAILKAPVQFPKASLRGSK
ncbi:DNA-directed RNA polymerase I subunit rpa49, partial [Kickxella alabastrina]